MLIRYRWLFAIVILAGVAACGGGSEIGEACDKEAGDGECVDGAMCAKSKAGSLLCLRECTQQTDCSTNTECTGTTGSTKVCQPNQAL